MAESESTHLLVAAFDFGTTYSGYAFSFRNDPTKVQTNQNWIAGSEKLISLKTPTCVLLSPDGKFHSFGFEAENKYGSLAEDEEHEGWLFFRRFKMLLHNNKDLTRETTVEDINGKSMPAMTIFSMSIRYLRDHLLNTLEKQTTGVEETDIQYVITVPAIWDDKSKQFMREAAIQAGLDTKRLKLALEPEAASIWCQSITTEAKCALSGSGTRYMVVDLGGGTADISVHEKNADGTLKELHKASGGPWGGMYVDNNYLQFLEQLFGKKAVEELKKEEMADYFDVLREFETKKRGICSDTTDLITFRISARLNELSEKLEKRLIKDKLAFLNLGAKVAIKRDKIRIDPSIVRRWFDCPIDNLITHLCGIMSEPDMKRVTSIILVGGFGECQYAQDKIKKALGNTRVIVPNEAGMAVLKGAVWFGHKPNIVTTRVVNFTYGISSTAEYEESQHPASSVEDIEGKRRVRHVFDKFVSSGDTVCVDHEVKKHFISLARDYPTHVRIFRSVNPNPRFTTDPECKELGQIEIKCSKDVVQDKRFEVMFLFGDTEVIVKARLTTTGEEFCTTIDCLK